MNIEDNSNNNEFENTDPYMANNQVQQNVVNQ
jgi:hypothetical protein